MIIERNYVAGACIITYAIQSLLVWYMVNNGAYGNAAFLFMMSLIPLSAFITIVIGNYIRGLKT